MTTTQERTEEPMTFEKVWAALMETRQRQEMDSRERKEAQTETDRQIKETREAIKETDQQMKETDRRMQETDRQMKETREAIKETGKLVARVTVNVGGLNRSMGELIETLIAARLWEKFDAYPYNLKRAYQRIPVYDENNKVLTDIDILLSNGDYVMAVEVKRELDRKDDVDHHLKRMELILKYPPDQCKGKKLIGAMAGGSVDPDIQEYAQSVGFFVLELTGEAVQLVEPPEGFSPRQW
jgi:hypothetical protein